jgi:DNA-binding CsgD family transcriptional regulator
LKFLASEQGVAVSTISVHAGECLKAMGLDPSPARAPMLCAMAVHAHRGLVRLPPARVEMENGDEVVSVSRPDAWLKSCLAPVEAQVASLRLEGFTGTHIATLRGTSARTVANQLSGIFGKFGVSGRGELLSLVIRISASLWGETAPSVLGSTTDRLVSTLRESNGEPSGEETEDRLLTSA